MGVAIPIPRGDALSSDANRRLQRLRGLSWFLDRSLKVGKWRIGFDPIIGLIPGAGDWIGAMLSLYVLYQGARLGMPAGVIARMGGNILVETVVGAVPVVGDLFDFAWQANSRNLALIERHYQPELEPRPRARIWAVVAVIVFLVLAVIVGLAVLLVKAINGLMEWTRTVA